MSTRSYICLEQEDGTLKGIYCHNDGHPIHNGNILIKHYASREKVEKLISLGDLSSLQKNIEPNPKLPHSFDYKERQKGVCIFYGRDGGEKDTEAKPVTPERAQKNGVEYIYVFGLDDEWRYMGLNLPFPRWQKVRESVKRLNEVLR